MRQEFLRGTFASLVGFFGLFLSSGHCSKPSFATKIQNVSVILGREAILECIVDSLGSNKVAWLKQDTETLLAYHTHTVTGEARLRVSNNNERHWYLHIGDVRLSDKGFYMCQINTEPMMNEVGYLDVLVAPSIVEKGTSSDTEVREFDSVSLRCQAEGYPQPSILWRREDGSGINTGYISGKRETKQRIESEFLNISSAHREDIGAYLCIASNGIPPAVSKRILLQVTFAPSIKVPVQLVAGAPGNNMSLVCVVEAWPKPLLSWKRKDTLLIEGSKYVVTEERSEKPSESYKAVMTLEIINVTTSDSGNYECFAENSYGNKTGIIRVSVINHTTTVRARPTTATVESHQKLRDTPPLKNDSQGQKVNYVITATNSLTDEGQDFRGGGKEISSKEDSKNGDPGLHRTPFQSPGRNGDSSGANSSARLLYDRSLLLSTLLFGLLWETQC